MGAVPPATALTQKAAAGARGPWGPRWERTLGTWRNRTQSIEGLDGHRLWAVDFLGRFAISTGLSDGGASRSLDGALFALLGGTANE
jgi:hypothetical protein